VGLFRESLSALGPCRGVIRARLGAIKELMGLLTRTLLQINSSLD